MLADANGLSLTKLAEWYDQPHIRAAIDALKRIATDRADLIAKDAASTSLSALTTLCTSLESEERNTLPAQDPRSRATRARNRDTLRKCAKDLRAAAGVASTQQPPDASWCHWSGRPGPGQCSGDGAHDPEEKESQASPELPTQITRHPELGTEHSTPIPTPCSPCLHNQHCQPASESPDPATAAPLQDSG
jgi:hypothetical protein